MECVPAPRQEHRPPRVLRGEPQPPDTVTRWEVPHGEEEAVAAVVVAVGGRLAPGALRAADAVNRHQVLQHRELATELEEPLAEVDVLPVEEVRVVEATESFPRRSVDQKARAGEPPIRTGPWTVGTRAGSTATPVELACGEPRR